jgi:hypothetical protein
MSDNQYDAFGDVITKQAGIFGGECAGLCDGLGDHDTTKTATTQQGVIVDMSCRGCGRPCRVVAEWPEMVAVKYNVSPRMVFGTMPGVLSSPTEWMFSQATNGWYPEQYCQHCRTPCNPHFTPAEAEQHLAVGRQRGWINPVAEQQLSQAAAQTRQRIAQYGR